MIGQTFCKLIDPRGVQARHWQPRELQTVCEEDRECCWLRCETNRHRLCVSGASYFHYYYYYYFHSEILSSLHSVQQGNNIISFINISKLPLDSHRNRNNDSLTMKCENISNSTVDIIFRWCCTFYDRVKEFEYKCSTMQYNVVCSKQRSLCLLVTRGDQAWQSTVTTQTRSFYLILDRI